MIRNVVAELTQFPVGKRNDEVCAWLKSLGLDPDVVTVPLWVEKTKDGQHVLWVTEQLNKVHPYTGDLMQNNVARKVPADSWPLWMRVSEG